MPVPNQFCFRSRRLLLLRTLILQWPLDIVTQGACCQQRPVRLTQKLTGQNRNISLTGTDDLIGLCWVSNHSHCASEYSRFTAHLFCELNLVSRTNRNFCASH